MNKQRCPNCDGYGYLIALSGGGEEVKCHVCNGTGIIEIKEEK